MKQETIKQEKVVEKNETPQKTKRKRIHKLGRKLLAANAILGIFILLAVDIAVGLVYLAMIMLQYPAEMQNAMKYISRDLDMEQIEKYADTLEKDEEYSDLVNFLNTARQDFELTGLSIIVPENDGILYIADGATTDDPLYCDLGMKDAYCKMEKVQLDALLQKGTPFSSVTNTKYGYLISTGVNLYSSDGRVIAVFEADMDVEDMETQAIATVIAVDFLLIFIMLLMHTIYFYYVNDVVIKPIHRLVNGSQEFMKGKGEDGKFKVLDVKHKSNDEIGLLVDSVVELENDVVEYMDNLESMTQKKEKLRVELSMATSIQANILPKIFPVFSNFKEFELYASMKPAKEVGGDLYDFFMVDKDHLGLVIGDVSGKGVPAALFMMVSKTLLKVAAMHGLQPGEVLSSVNNQLCESNDDSMFVTAWIGIMDIHTGHVIAANGGHEYPLIKHGDGRFELFKEKHGMPLGGLDGIPYETYEFDLEEGGAIFVYTDGVPEATNAAEELFGNDRMLEAINKDPDAKPEQILKNVREGVDAFVQDAPQFDDLTMLCVKRKRLTEEDNKGEENNREKEEENAGRNTAEEKKMGEQNMKEQSNQAERRKHYEITLEATTDNIEKVIDYMESQMEELEEVPQRTKMCISIAIDEICCNIVKHGYEDGTVQGNYTVMLDYLGDPDRLELSFIDSAWPYNPLTQAEQPDVNADMEERKIGGLGIYMVRETMDDASYEFVDGKNILKFIKMLAKEEES